MQRGTSYLSFMKCYGLHRDLHSFPTRRSSDLVRASTDGSIAFAWFWTISTYRVIFAWRSEEHTSELQSQSNLVCRLLLEKKKHALRWRRCQRLRNTSRYSRCSAWGWSSPANLN